MITVYNVVSSDGFIARVNGEEDFIPDDAWYKFLELCATHDVLVIGRKTYDAIQSYDEKLLQSFENSSIEKIVFSRNPAFNPKEGYGVLNSLNKIPKDKNVLVSSGPELTTGLFDQGVIDKVILYQLPITIGEGIKLLDERVKARLSVVSEEETINGIIFTYAVS
jgi:dihydrofolate reductase